MDTTSMDNKQITMDSKTPYTAAANKDKSSTEIIQMILDKVEVVEKLMKAGAK